MSNEDIKKVKVQPYPIEASILKPVTATGKIVRLNKLGFQMETTAHIRTNDRVEVKWEMPVSRRSYQAEALIVKVYEKLRGTSGEGKSVHLIEGHFRNPSTEVLQSISNFMEKIGQKNR